MQHGERLSVGEIGGAGGSRLGQGAAELQLALHAAAVADALADDVAHVAAIEVADNGATAAERLFAAVWRPALGHFDDHVGNDVAVGARAPRWSHRSNLYPRNRAGHAVDHNLAVGFAVR